MALNKTPVPLNFAQGLDTKSDPKQVPIGKLLQLQNSIFTKTGELVKRNGYATSIAKLPNDLQTTLTTLNNNLFATGSNLYAYSADTNQWLNKGLIQPVQLQTQSMVRSTTGQSSPDCAVASTGLAVLVYMDSGNSYYQISDSSTGQQIVARTLIPNAVNPRVFILASSFIITYVATVGGNPHLRYTAIPINTPFVTPVTNDISTNVLSLNAAYDAYIFNNNLYIAWAGLSNTIQITRIAAHSLIVNTIVTLSGHTATNIAISADNSNNRIILGFWDNTSNNGYVTVYSGTLAVILAPVQVITSQVINNLTISAANGSITALVDVSNTYTYSPNHQSNYINKITMTEVGTSITTTTIIRSVGLASKMFTDVTGVNYTLVAYSSINQPTYFLIDDSGNIYMKLAYANGGGYSTSQVLPTVSYVNGTYYTPYLIKDFLATVNKTTPLATGIPTNSIYTQVGINLAIFTINTNGQYSSEIASTLHLTGGILWQYDGVKPVENGFNVWPDDVTVTTATGSGSIAAGTYYYQFCYEWTDNEGNLHRSSPSIPISITTTTTSSTNTINVPMLRLTYKTTPNQVRIVGYRWSVNNQVYYQFTSITSPIVNNPTVDSITITDTLNDSAIIGNNILYTTGGVVENIAPPASIATALYKNRLFLVDAEDRNLLWFSKQVIENTPVEMSDLFTIYVAPTSGAQGSTGPITALSAMDDKLIIFKKDAIYYLTGVGPDNTGANNDFSDVTFITSAVGCANPNSIVLMPSGIMFQSDKGIWMLGRDLSTSYIGAPVEVYNSNTIVSAKAIPATNQVRFTLDNNVTLMYDYYFNQWGTFNNIQAISSTLFNGYDTYLNNLGQIYQETPNTYLDGSSPVLLSLTTGWISLAGVQGFERFYEMLILGSYYTPFKLQVQIAYDFNPSPSQSTLVIPDNYSGVWGSDSVWGGGSVWGGPSNILKARVFPVQQKCETFQLTLTEVYDNSFGVAPGQGLSLSGLNIVIGAKKGYRTQKASQSFG